VQQPNVIRAVREAGAWGNNTSTNAHPSINPLRVISSLAHHRHARREHCGQKRLCVSPADSTKSVFPGSRFKVHRLAASSLLPGTGSSSRPFTRPGRLRLSTPPSRGQSSRPATSDPQPAPPRPVRLFGSTTPVGSPQPWAASSPRARCRFLACRYRPTRKPYSPSGLLPPSGSKLSLRSAAKPAHRIRPISLRSPQPTLL
jgi:hypothetical protein